MCFSFFLSINIYATCLKTVVVGMQGHAPCKIPLLHKASFCVS